MDLRGELEKKTIEISSLEDQLQNSKSAASEVEALKEEIQLYHEAASSAMRTSNRCVCMECPTYPVTVVIVLVDHLKLYHSYSHFPLNSSLLMASEATGLRTKSDMDKHTILTDLETARKHLVAQERFSEQLQKELDTERDRTRNFNRDKLAAESKCVELEAERNKVVATLGDAQFTSRKIENELERASQREQQLKTLLEEDESRIEHLEKNKSEVSEMLRKTNIELREKDISERDMSLQVY